MRNVTMIVGLRAYAAKSNILPEQTLGRGLRRMYFGSDQRETVSVMGTPAFMEFVESIQSEGVTFEHVPMGGARGRDRQDSAGRRGRQGQRRQRPRRAGHRPAKAQSALQPRVQGPGRARSRVVRQPPSCRSKPSRRRRPARSSSRRCSMPRLITQSISMAAARRTTAPWSGFFARQLLKDLRLVGGYDLLYPKVKTFMRDHLFTSRRSTWMIR